MIFHEDNQALVGRQQGETLRIEAWGENSLRVRATMRPEITDQSWALTGENVLTKEFASMSETIPVAKTAVSHAEKAASSKAPASEKSHVRIYKKGEWKGEAVLGARGCGVITNGRLKAVVNWRGVISFYKDDELILREHYRSYDGTISNESRCLKTVNRECKALPGGDYYALTVNFESNDGEKIFGMGQYQQPYLDQKGSVLELAQRNSQVSVPFALSSLGYGFLWNNPAVGRVTFGKNRTEWQARATAQMDYWITVGDTPKEIMASYANVTGHAPMFPESLMGLWQCKLRYRTQEEVLEVARRYLAEGIQIDLIIIDFFHWTVQGDWKFDPVYWPDPKAMVNELHSMGIRVMVSVWPSVDRRSENFWPMMERGLLIKTERGAAQTYDYQGDCVEIDAFNPEARQYVWEACKRNYADLGIDGFWLDNSEPDFGVYDYDHYRYYAGSGLSCSNLYPQMYSKAFYENMLRNGQREVVNLIRCGWAGSQKYGNVIWSGDIPSTFEALKDQLQAGLNMGLAGIPWWTTDIGGFMTDDVNDPDFRQLLIRWYQFAVYTAVLRMHGDRGPYNIPPLDERDWGGGYLHTGQPNELWSYGEENYQIMRRYYDIRISMHDYIRDLYREAHENGSPLMRTMFYEFPDDAKCWSMEDQYMFGDRYLVAPILHLNEFTRSVYLPAGQWRLTGSGKIYAGGQTVSVEAPITYMPVFERMI